MNIDQFRAALHGGLFDDNLDEVVEEIRARKHTLTHRLVANLKVGDRITISTKVNPKYLGGLTATVTKIMHEYVTIDLDGIIHGPNGKRWYRGIRMPMSLIAR